MPRDEPGRAGTWDSDLGVAKNGPRAKRRKTQRRRTCIRRSKKVRFPRTLRSVVSAHRRRRHAETRPKRGWASDLLAEHLPHRYHVVRIVIARNGRERDTIDVIIYAPPFQRAGVSTSL